MKTRKKSVFHKEKSIKKSYKKYPSLKRRLYQLSKVNIKFMKEEAGEHEARE